MSQYIVKVENTSGVAGTIISDRAFSYTDNLNSLNEGQLRITGTGETKRGLFEIGSKVYFYRNSTLEFTGLINSLSYLDAGGISANLKGYEVWLGKENGDYANSPWNSTASATIATAIIGESSYFTAGTIETGADIDLKVEVSSSLYNALASLTKSTGQDIGIDYTNLEVDILDHKGSSTSVATLNDRIQITDLTVRKSYPIGNDIRVFGKGDGNNQIKSNSATSGQDAASKATYGTIRKEYIDSSVISQTQADNLADKLVAKYKDPISIYEFDVINPNLNVVCGDVITLNSKTKDLSNEEVRIVGIEKGVRGDQEFLTLQVANKEYSAKERNIEKYLSELQKENNENQTYMQGTTNILNFSEMINANNSAPLRVKAYFSESDITDEAGNLRVNSFKLDYDVDPFRSGVGSASESDVAPTVGGTSASTAPGVSGSSSNTTPGVSGSSANTQPGVAGNSGSYTSYTSVGIDTSTSTACSNGVWTTVATVRPGASYLNMDLLADLWIIGNSGGAEDIEIRIGNDAVYGTISPGVVGSGATVWGTYADGFRDTSMITTGKVGVGPVTSSTHDIFAQIRPQSGAISLMCGMHILTVKHLHDDGTYAAANHLHADGTYSATSHLHADGSYAAASHGHADGSYAAASHNHSVSIGDGISDAGSVNASEVNIYVDFWNGSSWVNKHSVLTTGKTIDYDVDLSDGGTYPDAAGFWRARVLTDSVDADLVQGTIKCKHELDT